MPKQEEKISRGERMQFQAHNDIKKEVRAHIEQKKRDDEVGGCETGVIEDDASFFFS